MSPKTAATRTGRLPIGRAVPWTGTVLGAFLAAEALLHGLVLPLSLGGFGDAAMTVVLIVALAVVLAELTRRHHRAVAGHVIRHGRQGASAAARHARRHGSTVRAWLVSKAAPRWENRQYRPVMFRRLRAAREPEGGGEGTPGDPRRRPARMTPHIRGVLRTARPAGRRTTRTPRTGGHGT